MKLAKATQAEIDALMSWLQDLDTSSHDLPKPPPFLRIVFGYETLVNNCCDPTKDYLDWSKDIEAAKEDSKRLDFAENCWIHSKGASGGSWGVVEKDKETSFGNTLREAIDAARKRP